MPQEFKPKPAIPQTADSSGQDERALIIREIIHSRVKTFNPFRRTRIPEWNINIGYLCGHQYLGMQGGIVVERPSKDLTPFATTVNKIGPAVRNDVAMATKVPPVFDVVPETTDHNDRATAIAGQKMISYLRKLNNFDAARGKVIIWYDIAAIGWRKQYWDPYHKVIGHNPELEQDGHNPNMEAGQPIYQGEAISKHTPTNELIYDWRQDTDNLPWMIHARPMTKAEIMIRFGQEKAALIPEGEFIDPNTGMDEFEIRLYNEFHQFTEQTTGAKPQLDSTELGQNDKQVMVYELWQVRDNNYPMGMYAVMAGLDTGIILQDSPYPIEQYPHGEVPFTSYDMMLPDKAVAGTASRISQARPIQDELNEIRSLIRENTATMGSGVWMAPRGSKLNVSRMDNSPGLIVEYDSPYKPNREAGVPIAGQLFIYAGTIVNDLNDIFSFPQVAQGKRPQGGPKSGVGIHLLQEAAVTQHSPITTEMDRKDEHAIKQLLSIAFANYGNRTFQIVGKDNEWTLFEFDKDSYTNNYNVQVRRGSSLPISKAIERDLTLGLLNMGLLGNPQDPTVRRRVLEVIDIGGLDKVLKDNAKDTAFAKKEFQTPVQQYQQLLQQGNIPPEQLLEQIYLPAANPFDNHEVHVIEHKNDLLDKFFEYLGSGDPGLIAIANAMQAHWMQHSKVLAQQQLQQAIMTGQIKAEDVESSKQKAESKESSEKSS
jgi:hypothetical protein